MAIVRDSGSPVGCRAASLGGDGAWDDAGCKDGGGVAESLPAQAALRLGAAKPSAGSRCKRRTGARTLETTSARCGNTISLSCPRPSLLPPSCPSCAAACTRPLARLPPFCPREAPTASAICRRVQAQYLLGVQSRPFVHSPVPLQLPRALKSSGPRLRATSEPFAPNPKRPDPALATALRLDSASTRSATCPSRA